MGPLSGFTLTPPTRVFQPGLQHLRHALKDHGRFADPAPKNSSESPNQPVEGPSTGYQAPQNSMDAVVLKKNNEHGNAELSIDSSLEKVVSITETDELSSDDLLDLDDDREFPDGGLQAWSVVFGSFMGLIPVFGLFNSLGAVESYISKHQLASVSSSTISWVFSIYLAISFLSCIFAGGYFDRNGSAALMWTGTIMFVGSILALANCKAFWQFVVGFSVLCGFGTGVLMTPLVSSVATWFLRKRAIATSTATMGGSVGGIFIPIMLRKLYEEVGYAWAIRILALLCALCLSISAILTKERQKPVAEPFQSSKQLIKWYYESSFNWRYFMEGKFLFTALGAAFAECSLTASATYMTSYSLKRGNTESMSFALITANNAMGLLGRYVPGYVADKHIGRFNVCIITILMAAIFNYTIWLPFGGHTRALWAYVCLYGFSTGSILSLTPVCIGQISRTTDFGKRYATLYFTEAILSIPVLPVGGLIIGQPESINGYNNFIVFTSTLMTAGAVSLAIARYICVGPRLSRF